MEHYLVGKLLFRRDFMIIINVAKEFTDAPGGRYKKDGNFSGEEFRETLLYPRYIEAIEKGEKLCVNLDGCYGYPSSFLDEAFGGLARKLNDKNILDNIEIISNDEPGIIQDIQKDVSETEL